MCRKCFYKRTGPLEGMESNCLADNVTDIALEFDSPVRLACPSRRGMLWRAPL